MTNNPEHIFIFRSNIVTDQDKYAIEIYLDSHPLIEQWSIDMDDEDRILRIISSKLKEQDIISLVSNYGYNCEALKD